MVKLNAEPATEPARAPGSPGSPGSADQRRQCTREEGLRRLSALIDEKPVAQTCEDIMAFLNAFKKNKNAWHVTKADLQRLYMQKRSKWVLFKQFLLTRKCCPKYETFLD